MYANKVEKMENNVIEENVELASPSIYQGNTNTDGNWTVKSLNAPTEIAHNDSEGVIYDDDILNTDAPIKDAE